VEGVDQISGSRTVSDRKLYRALHPGFDRVTVVAGGGKADCIRLRELLGKTLLTFSTRIRAVALLDRDLATAAPPPGVLYLPVSMIENFLLDPHAIWEAIQSVVEKTAFKSVDDVSAGLDTVLDGQTADEVERRVVQAVGRHLFQPRAPIESIPDQADEFVRALLAVATAERVGGFREAAGNEVAELKSSFQRREQFHGKEALAVFLKTHLSKTGMAAGIFRYEAARHARSRRKVMEFFDAFFRGALPEVDAPSVAGSQSDTGKRGN
jgi:hypothetical protein